MEQFQKDLKTVISTINKQAKFGGRLRVENLPAKICEAITPKDVMGNYSIIVVTDEKEQVNQVLAGRNQENTLYLYQTGSVQSDVLPQISTTTNVVRFSAALTKRLSAI